MGSSWENEEVKKFCQRSTSLLRGLRLYIPHLTVRLVQPAHKPSPLAAKAQIDGDVKENLLRRVASFLPAMWSSGSVNPFFLLANRDPVAAGLQMTDLEIGSLRKYQAPYHPEPWCGCSYRHNTLLDTGLFGFHR